MAATKSGNARVLLIRHGESTNNVLSEELVKKVKDGSASRDDVMVEWLKRRSSDPALTDMGHLQARDLAEYLAPVLAEEIKAGSPVFLSCSPMLRACLTVHPLGKALAELSSFSLSDVEVRSDAFEVHGHYSGKERRSGACQTAAEIKGRFGFNTSKLATSGPWWSSGFESRTDAVARARRVAQELRSADFRERKLKGRGIFVLVAHADFLDLLLQEALHVRTSVNEAPPILGEGDSTYSATQKGNRPHLFNFQNTSRTMLKLLPDSSVRVAYIGRAEHTKNIKTPSRL